MRSSMSCVFGLTVGPMCRRRPRQIIGSHFSNYSLFKEFDHALAAIERAIETDSEVFSWNPLGMRSLIRRKLGDIEGAEADCQEAARIELHTPLQYANRGIRNVCNDIGGGLEDLNQVIALAPKWYAGYVFRGQAQSKLGHHKEALIDLNRAIELAPHFSGSYMLRGWMYAGQGRFEDALADQKKATELDPYSAQNLDYYGYMLFQKGRIEEALVAFESALKLNPMHVNVHADRGRILAHLGRCDEAAAEMRKAVELAFEGSWPPSIVDGHTYYFYYHCPDHYDLAEALQHAQAQYEADPTDSWSQGTLALALLRNGDYGEAKRLYLELFEDLPDRAPWFPLAMSLWHLGEKAEARRFYDRSVSWMDERLPDSPVYINMRLEAAELLGIAP